jgi:hypothetical protein
MARKPTFTRMSAEITKVSAAFPAALKVGVADGAKTNWPFLTKHTSRQILDFYHAAEYLTQFADAQFARDPRARKQWLDDACSDLKHDKAGPSVLLIADAKLPGRKQATRSTIQN